MIILIAHRFIFLILIISLLFGPIATKVIQLFGDYLKIILLRLDIFFLGESINLLKIVSIIELNLNSLSIINSCC